MKIISPEFFQKPMVCQSSRLCSLSQTLLIPMYPTGRLPVSSQGTVLQRSEVQLVSVRVSCPIDGKYQGWDPLAACWGRGYGTGGGTGRCVHGGCPTDGTDHADRGVAVSAPIHSQWDIFRGALMEGFLLTVLCHQSPQLIWTLWWMRCVIWHLPQHRLQ